MAATGRRRREDGTSDERRDPERRTRERAYLLWERAGSPEGRADEFWEQARRNESVRAAAEDEERINEEGCESFPASAPPSRIVRRPAITWLCARYRTRVRKCGGSAQAD